MNVPQEVLDRLMPPKVEPPKVEPLPNPPPFDRDFDDYKAHIYNWLDYCAQRSGYAWGNVSRWLEKELPVCRRFPFSTFPTNHARRPRRK